MNCGLHFNKTDLLLPAMSTERTPLVTGRGCSLTMATALCGPEQDSVPESSSPSKDPRKLNTFFGVMVPTILSMFSIILFLRTGEQRPDHTVRLPTVDVRLMPTCFSSAGFVVGHAGLLQGLLMLVVAYTIISLTILSICAISTNGAIQGGGAYCILGDRNHV